MTPRVRLFDFLATPANLYLWFCARLCGLDFEFGPCDEDGEFADD